MRGTDEIQPGKEVGLALEGKSSKCMEVGKYKMF